MGLTDTLLFVVLVLGAGLGAFLVRKNNTQLLKLLLSFTGAYIIGITFLHLVPMVYGGSGIQAGWYVLLGFFIQLLLENLSKGIEHGHIHMHEHKKHSFAISVLVGLCVHSLLEGLPLSHAFEGAGGDASHLHDHGHHHHHHGFSDRTHLYWGIVAHHMPAAFALGALFINGGFSRLVTIGALLLFTLMTPAGAWIAGIAPWGENGFNILVSIVIGAFLHISTTILFEQEDAHHHHISWRKLLAIAGGLGIAIATSSF